ncbi:MAG TPA: 30S ribosomal protein S8 [Candidatus Eremiobacteraceae bacterium]|jgi:small subunit ribosomal protein S8|nr:30S ribosomal protein S8 [Candidatus Eremiobacteraceae bacterium]
MQTDPIGDFLTRIRNAAAAKHQRVDVPVSKLKTEIARILKEEGYISTFKLVDENKSRKLLRVFLKYTPDRRSVITGLKRISRPGARRYVGALDIRPVVGGLGISILTTPKGLMSGRSARKSKTGGELLCEIW